MSANLLQRIDWDKEPINGLTCFFTEENYLKYSPGSSFIEKFEAKLLEFTEAGKLPADSIDHEKSSSQRKGFKENVGISSTKASENAGQHKTKSMVEHTPKQPDRRPKTGAVRGAEGGHLLSRSLPYPRLSSLSHAEQKAYLGLHQNYLSHSKTQLFPEQLKELQQLQEKVTQEQDDFRKYLEKLVLKCHDDYNYIHPEARRFVEERINQRRSRINDYPRYYSTCDTIAMATNNEDGCPPVAYHGPVLEMGQASKVTLPNMSNPFNMPRVCLEYEKVNKRFPTTQPKQEPNTWNHEVCSKDVNAEILAQKYHCSIVASASVLKCLVDNHAPDYNNSWEIPIIVQDYPAATDDDKDTIHRVVYLDKPFPKKILHMRSKNQIFHKFGLKCLLSHPKHVKGQLPFSKIKPESVNPVSIVNNPFTSNECDNMFDVDDMELIKLETFGTNGMKSSTKGDQHVIPDQRSMYADNDNMFDVDDTELMKFETFGIETMKSSTKGDQHVVSGRRSLCDDTVLESPESPPTETTADTDETFVTKIIPLDNNDLPDTVFKPVCPPISPRLRPPVHPTYLSAFREPRASNPSNSPPKKQTVKKKYNTIFDSDSSDSDSDGRLMIMEDGTDGSKKSDLEDDKDPLRSCTTLLTENADIPLNEGRLTNVDVKNVKAEGNVSDDHKTDTDETSSMLNTMNMKPELMMQEPMKGDKHGALSNVRDTGSFEDFDTHAQIETDKELNKAGKFMHDNPDPKTAVAEEFVCSPRKTNTFEDKFSETTQTNSNLGRGIMHGSDTSDNNVVTGSQKAAHRGRGRGKRARRSETGKEILKESTPGVRLRRSGRLSDAATKKELETRKESSVDNEAAENRTNVAFDGLDTSKHENSERENNTQTIIQTDRIENSDENFETLIDRRGNSLVESCMEIVSEISCEGEANIRGSSACDNPTDSESQIDICRKQTDITAKDQNDRKGVSGEEDEDKSVNTEAGRCRINRSDSKISSEIGEKYESGSETEKTVNCEILKNDSVSETDLDRDKDSEMDNSMCGNKTETAQLPRRRGRPRKQSYESPRLQLRSSVKINTTDTTTNTVTPNQEDSHHMNLNVPEICASPETPIQRKVKRRKTSCSAENVETESGIGMRLRSRNSLNSASELSENEQNISVSKLSTKRKRRTMEEDRSCTEDSNVDTKSDVAFSASEGDISASQELATVAVAVDSPIKLDESLSEAAGIQMLKSTESKDQEVIITPSNNEESIIAKGKMSKSASKGGNLDAKKSLPGKSGPKPPKTDTTPFDSIMKMQEKMLDTDSSPRTSLPEVPGSTQSNHPPGSSFVRLDPKQSSQSISYHLWSFSQTPVLIRCGYHGTLRDDQHKMHHVTISPKLEYLPMFGFEQISLQELSRNWISSYIRPNSKIIYARINAYTSELLTLDEMDMSKILQPASKLAFNPEKCIIFLQRVFDCLKSQTAGQYLLCHESGESSCSLKKATESKRGCYDLHIGHTSFMSSVPPDSKYPPWIPIDPNLMMPYHRKNGRIPATFEPKDYVPFYKQHPKGPGNKRKKKKKGHAKKQ